LAKGGYSYVFWDKEKQIVSKKIKTEKIKSITSLNTIIEEITNGAFYKYIRSELGIALSCHVNFDNKPKILILEMKLLEGTTMGKSDNSFNHFEDLYTIKNVISLIADLHSTNLFHWDIKAENIYVLNDKTSFDSKKLVLIDFAFSCWTKFDKRYKGTRKYMPDE